MRKSTKISAGLGVVAGLAVALAPLGAFAASTNMGTDTITVTIATSCEMEAGDADSSAQTVTPFANTYSGNLEAGSIKELGAGDITGGGTATTGLVVTCNDDEAASGAHGYYIKALATDLTGTDATHVIPADVDPVAGTSGWGGKFSLGQNQGDMALETGFDDYKAFGTTLVTIASGNVSAADGDTLNIEGYAVSASASQEADTYTGTVTYSFVAPQA